jgi:hypothetical protein
MLPLVANRWFKSQNLTDGRSERSERFDQDSLGGARKAEGASGAGRTLTPEAMPSNGKEMDGTEECKTELDYLNGMVTKKAISNGGCR